MILLLIIFTPLLGGILAWLVGRRNNVLARYVAIITTALQFLMLFEVLMELNNVRFVPAEKDWLVEWQAAWIPQLGATIHLAADGLSLLMLLLTSILGIVVALNTRTEPDKPQGACLLCLLATLSGISGAFLAVDLLLFFVFFEAMLIPMYFLIIRRGESHHRNFAAAVRFVIFTQAGSLLMLFSILALGLLSSRTTGVMTMDYKQLQQLHLDNTIGALLLFGFLAAFAVKLPMVPFHGWQPATYAVVPANGGILLSGAMAKVGAYGLIRFGVQLFPEASRSLSVWIMTLAVISILYGSFMAFAQKDVRKFIAYSSISHLGFVVLGIFSFTEMGYVGAVVLMLAHGCSVAGLFLLAGILERQPHGGDMDRVGGLWSTAPRLGIFALIMVMAALGLPGLGNFIGEFLILLSIFKNHLALAVLAALGTVFSAAYALRLMQMIFFGTRRGEDNATDLSEHSALAAAILVLALLALGIYPKPVLDFAKVVKDRPGYLSFNSTSHGDQP